MPKEDEGQVHTGASGDSLLERLPIEVLQGPIAEYLSKEDLLRLSQVSRTMFFTYCDPLAKTLLSHIVKGEEAEALQMIDANPHLLRIRSKAIDYSGRIYQDFMPFQAALLCHDVTIWKKIEPYFDKLPNGREEKIRQFKALFPEGLPQQEPYDFNTLVQVISASPDVEIKAALEKTQNDTKLCQALTTFRSDFTAVAMKEIFFNPLHLIEAFNIYNAQFDRWSWNQRDLFWRQVIGYTQRFLPACDAQAFCQGLDYIVEENGPRARALNFRFGSGSFFPLSESSGLGFDWAAAVAARTMPGAPDLRLGRWPDAARLVDKLCRANTAELFEFEHRMRCSDSLTSQSCCTIS